MATLFLCDTPGDGANREACGQPEHRQRPGGVGTESCLQIPRAVGALISR